MVDVGFVRLFVLRRPIGWEAEEGTFSRTFLSRNAWENGCAVAGEWLYAERYPHRASQELAYRWNIPAVYFSMRFSCCSQIPVYIFDAFHVNATTTCWPKIGATLAKKFDYVVCHRYCYKLDPFSILNFKLRAFSLAKV